MIQVWQEVSRWVLCGIGGVSAHAVAIAGPTTERNALSTADRAALKAQVFKSVGARGFVLSTDKAGRVMRTTEASDFRIRKVTFDPQTDTADVVVVLERDAMVANQNRRRWTEGWAPAEQQSARIGR